MPEQFFVNWNYLCEKWKPFLPVYTLTGTLNHKRSFLAHTMKQYLKERVGYTVEPWWQALPIIDPEYALHGDNIDAQDSVPS